MAKQRRLFFVTHSHQRPDLFQHGAIDTLDGEQVVDGRDLLVNHGELDATRQRPIDTRELLQLISSGNLQVEPLQQLAHSFLLGPQPLVRRRLASLVFAECRRRLVKRKRRFIADRPEGRTHDPYLVARLLPSPKSADMSQM